MYRTLMLASVAGLGLLLPLAQPAAAQAGHDHYHVMYRLSCWQERDFDCHLEAHRFERLMRQRGFDAHVVHHRNHYHVRYRMLQWRLYRTVYCHVEAHELERMLVRRGYEARVIHH